jgi:hypothetical protein
MFLCEDILVWLVLAFGGAMCVGNVLAIVRPPTRRTADGDLERAPVARTVAMALVGGVAAAWALISLLSG